jgi:hypothetical protein
MIRIFSDIVVAERRGGDSVNAGAERVGLALLADLVDQYKQRAAVGTAFLAAFLDRQIHLRVGIPQAHSGQGTVQWQVLAGDLVQVLVVRGGVAHWPQSIP